MATPSYSYSELKNEIVDQIPFANVGSFLTIRQTINRAARRVLAEIDLRSTIRRSQISPKLFDDQYDYTAPTDLKGRAIIDLQPQGSRSVSQKVYLVTEKKFDAHKSSSSKIITVADDELVRKLRVNIDADDSALTIGTMNSLTADGGTWELFGDATNVVADTDNFIQGGGSIKFDLVGSGTTAGISNTGLTTFDITDYINNGSVFMWVYINSTTNLTNFILRIGNDITANYYTQTVTTTNEGAAFVNGWNLLRFDFASMSQTGTVTPTTCDSVAVYMTKTSGKSDDGYRVDNIVLHTGEYYDILYYSRYPWQSNANAYLEDSTADTDLINADTEEIDLFTYRGKYEVFKDLKMKEDAAIALNDYKEAKRNYVLSNPSQRLKLIDTY